LAGKPVIYAAWGLTFEDNKSTLIRFDLESGLVNHAESPSQLQKMLENSGASLQRSDPKGLVAAVTELGPVDGLASQRVIHLMRQFESTPAIPNISNTQPMRTLNALLFSVVFSAGVLVSEFFLPSRTEAFRRRKQLCIQVVQEFSLIRKRQKRNLT